MIRSDKGSPDLDEETPGGIIVALGSHAIHLSMLIGGRLCKKPLVQN